MKNRHSKPLLLYGPNIIYNVLIADNIFLQNTCTAAAVRMPFPRNRQTTVR